MAGSSIIRRRSTPRVDPADVPLPDDDDDDDFFASPAPVSKPLMGLALGGPGSLKVAEDSGSVPAHVLAAAALAAVTPVPDSDDEEEEDQIMNSTPPCGKSREQRPQNSWSTKRASLIGGAASLPPSSFALAQLAAKIPVPDSDDEEDFHSQSLVNYPTQFFNLHDDDDLSSATTSCSSRRPSGIYGGSVVGGHSRLSLVSQCSAATFADTDRAAAFVEWLRWKQPYYRFEGNADGCGWEWPLSKCEKRELLMLIMASAEQDAHDGNEQAVRHAIAAAAPAPCVKAKLISVTRRSRASVSKRKLQKGRPRWMAKAL